MSIRQSETATYASGAIWWSKLQLMQVTPSDGQIFNLWWANLQLVQMAPSGGQICDLCKWCYVVAKFKPSHGVNFWVHCAFGNVSSDSFVFILSCWSLIIGPCQGFLFIGPRYTWGPIYIWVRVSETN